MSVALLDAPFDPWVALQSHQDAMQKAGAFGALASFVGYMRDFNEAEAVRAMHLEHYPGMTEKALDAIVAEACERRQLLDVLVLHRVGDLNPGDPIVLVAVWSAHRAAAFDACREIMEALKSRAPLWKKETLADGTRWVEHNTPG